MESNNESENVDTTPDKASCNPWSDAQVLLFGLLMYLLGCYAGYTGHVNQLKEEHYAKLVAEEQQRAKANFTK